MIGAIIGDIAGSRFEFNNYKKKDFELFSEECHVTDDSILTLAVAKAIMETCKVIRPLIGKPETREKFYVMAEWMANKYLREIGRKYPECGYGGMFAQWIQSVVPKPYNSFGNGAAMRVSPAGFVAGTEGEAISLADAVTQVTHNHEEGMKGAEAVAVAIFMARHGKSKMEIRKRISSDYYLLDFTIDVIRDAYEFNETCQGTVPQSIEAFLESTSFEDAIRIAISLGGDSDTLAAITGSVAEAFYGVPDEIRERALAYLDPYLRGIYDDWIAFIRDRKENNNKSTVPEKENKDNGI